MEVTRDYNDTGRKITMSNRAYRMLVNIADGDWVHAVMIIATFHSLIACPNMSPSFQHTDDEFYAANN